MQEHELNKIIETIKSVTEMSIEKTVNGKIKSLDEKISKHIEDFKNHVKNEEEQREDTLEVIKKIIPLVEAWETVDRLSIFFGWLSKFILAAMVIFGLIKYIK